jgi:hypothetical protein
MFRTETCINGSFLALPDTHFRTSSNNSGIDLDKVIAVMEKLRSCDPKIEKLVCIIDFLSSTSFFLYLFLVIRTYSIYSFIIT